MDGQFRAIEFDSSATTQEVCHITVTRVAYDIHTGSVIAGSGSCEGPYWFAQECTRVLSLRSVWSAGEKHAAN